MKIIKILHEVLIVNKRLEEVEAEGKIIPALGKTVADVRREYSKSILYFLDENDWPVKFVVTLSTLVKSLKVLLDGESLMEKHIVSRSEISVERHFDHSCSLSLNAVMKLLQLLDRDMEKGDEEKCPALSVAKNSAAKNTSLYGMILKNRASGSVEVQNAFELLNAN